MKPYFEAYPRIAIRLNPEYAAPYNNRGNARSDQGDLTPQSLTTTKPLSDF